MRSLRCLAVLLLMGAAASAQIPDSPDANISNIPVNYTEAKVVQYTLPDPLKLSNGEPVRDAATWFEKRRPELIKLFEENQYGRVPATAPKVTWQVLSTDPNALEGKAIMKQLAGRMGGPDGPAIDATLYVPAKAGKPAPVLINLTFSFGPPRGRGRAARTPMAPPATVMAQAAPARGNAPAAPARGRGGPMMMRNVAADMIAHGFGYATINYNSIEPDTLEGIKANLARGLALAQGRTEPAPDEWGAIASWAWGISRLVDYLETEPGVDAKRIAITGCSRLGKTVMWAGARDTRIAMVIDSCSGEGGSAISRRNYGETVGHLVAKGRFPYQFCANYAKWADKVNEMPVDAHMLAALIAPRPLLIQTGTTDIWSDPYGMFLAAVGAEPVYKLLGKEGLGTAKMPPAGDPILHTVGFLMHEGGHGMVDTDWDVFIRFMEMHLKP
ncbi:MAG: acetylxylan esterase [Phycisphaerae bacterium]|nr:acetylxylan esterase [Phycisphaerae bacterium]